MAPAESATSRLARLLTMVPWLLGHQGVDLQVAAREFGISPGQLEADLSLLFVCGTPGHLPDDLIEAEWEGGRVYVGNADSIARPLRLTLDEALTLMVGLKGLASVSGIEEHDALSRALAKLEAAAGTVASASSLVQVTIGEAGQSETLRLARDAVSRRRRVHLRYLVQSRDESTERDVDPMRVLSLDGRWYLEGWCHRAEAVRTFRLDRIERADILDADGTPPPHAQPRDLGQGLFVAREEDARVVLDTDAQAAWISDYYPAESVAPRPGGGLRIALRTADPAWVARVALRAAGHAWVVEPASLVEHVRAMALAALASYGTGPGARGEGQVQPGASVSTPAGE